MAKIPFIDNITWDDSEENVVAPSSITVDVNAEIRLWASKIQHLEIPNPGKGDDIGFILAFGNDGELTTPASTAIPPVPTLEDTLTIKSPIDLKLMSLCIGSEYELWVVSENNLPVNYQVTRCKVFQSGSYTLQLRRRVNGGPATAYFDIPCHYICSIAMLFQIEFPGCPECPDDCGGRPVDNGSFENGLTGWIQTVPVGASISTVSTFVRVAPSIPKTYNPIDGTRFALLKTDGPGNYTSLRQTISVCPGDTVEGYAFFYTEEAPNQPAIFDDTANVKILDNNGNLVSNPFTAKYTAMPPTYGITDWVKWSYTFTQGGTYTLLGEVANSVDSIFDSYLGLDAIKIVKP